MATACLLGIKRSTAYKIVQRDSDKPKGGAKNVKVDNEMISFVTEKLEDNPMITIKNLNQELRQALPNKPFITDRTLSNAIDGLTFTLKLARNCPAERNSDENIAAREEYANWFMSGNVINSIKIYVDEFGVNIHTRQNRGRSQVGTRVYRQVSGQSGRNITVCAAISSTYGLVYFQVYEGGMNSERFGNFLQIACGNIIASGDNNDGFVIFDNAPCHRNIESRELPGIYPVKRLPKYSPFLNPIENAFSAWKQAIKNDLSREQHLFINAPRFDRNGLTIGEYRFLLLKNIIERCSATVTVAKCVEWQNHTMVYIPRCLARQAIDG